jgi:hypothetical protein
MYYGHGSWLVLLAFGAMFALRAFNHRGARRPGSAPGSSFTAAPPATPSTTESPAPGGTGDPSAPGYGAGGMGVTTFTGVPAGWLADPSGRHQQRYWSGSGWTDHVTDDGVPGSDRPPESLRS